MDEHIRQSNLIERIDDPAYDKQGKYAWEYLSGIKKLNFSVVCKVQKINTLLQNDLMPHQRGYTRSMSKVNVMVGNNVPPSWFMVDDLLRNWILDMTEHWKTLDPLEMHIRFEHIHPFVDGNGRTGRMLMWWHEQKQGKVPTLIRNDTKFEKYYPLF